MSNHTGISWTDRTWNPVVGCTKVSQGCKHCYAKTIHDQRHAAFLAGKLQNLPQYAEPFETVQMLPERLTDPLGWRKPSRVFVNSMSDLFHEDVPFDYIALVFGVMMLSPRHTYQILTKRPSRMLAFFAYMDDHPHAWPHVAQLRAAMVDHFFSLGAKASRIDKNRIDAAPYYGHEHTRWPLPNVWLGVSVENQAAADERIPLLLDTPAAVRFLSCEPLLGPVDLTRIAPIGTVDPHGAIAGDALAGGVWERPGRAERWTRRLDEPLGVDWVIVGGESGKGARPMHPDWARLLRDQCTAAGVAFHFKQWGAYAPMGHCSANNPIGPDGEHGQILGPETKRGLRYMWGTRKWLKMIGRKLDDREWNEFPAVAR